MTVRRDTEARRKELFEEAAAIIAFEYADGLTVDGIARRLFVSRRQLQRAFADAGQGNFRSHVCQVRMERAAELLSRGMSVRGAAGAVGYSQPAQFAKAFRRHHGHLPSEQRGRHENLVRAA